MAYPCILVQHTVAIHRKNPEVFAAVPSYTKLGAIKLKVKAGKLPFPAIQD